MLDVDCLVTSESHKYLDLARKWTFNCHDIDLLGQFQNSNLSMQHGQRITVKRSEYSKGELMCRVDTVAGHASASVEIEPKGKSIEIE
jgi:hypothetical protein